MIDSRTKLTVFQDDNGVFADYSDSAADYIRDDFSITLIAAEDYIYMGFDKPFNATYWEFTTANTSANTFTFERYDGTTWVALTVQDETKGWTRSGYWTWDSTDMNSVEINSVTKFYIRAKPSTDHTATTARGANLVFSDDISMKTEFFEVDNSNIIPSGETSHIAVHQASRDKIIQDTRNNSYFKSNATTGIEMVNQWDFLDIQEIKDAAKWLALSKIFFNLSDSQDDHWNQKQNEAFDNYEKSMRLVLFSVDNNDDGVKDDSEKQSPYKPTRWVR